MKPIKVMQIGGMHDHSYPTMQSMLRLTDFFEVIGLADANLEAAKAKTPNAPAYFTIEEALDMNDIEAVAIECEEEKALHYAQMFAERGIPIHLDKPGSAFPEQFQKLIQTVKEKQIPLQMGYMYRYNPVVVELLKHIKAGVYGEIFSVEAQMSVRHDKEKREWLSKYPGGMMYFLGCHLIDLVLQIQGMPKEILTMNCATGVDGVEAEDYGFCVFKYGNGVSFVKSCATEYNGFARRQLVVTGSKGSIEIKPFEMPVDLEGNYGTGYSVTLEQNHPAQWGEGSERCKSEKFNRYDAMMSDFAKFIAGEKKNPYSYEYEEKLFMTIMKCCGVIQ